MSPWRAEPAPGREAMLAPCCIMVWKWKFEAMEGTLAAGSNSLVRNLGGNVYNDKSSSFLHMASHPRITKTWLLLEGISNIEAVQGE